jgi:hypothetical protein
LIKIFWRWLTSGALFCHQLEELTTDKKRTGLMDQDRNHGRQHAEIHFIVNDKDSCLLLFPDVRAHRNFFERDVFFYAQKKCTSDISDKLNNSGPSGKRQQNSKKSLAGFICR